MKSIRRGSKKASKFSTIFPFFGLVVIFLMVLNSCIDLSPAPIPMKTRDGSSGWIEIKTGLTDSLNNKKWLYGLDETALLGYAISLDNDGFELTWSTMEEAEFYEIRVAKQKIIEESWDKAALAATVTDNNNYEITTTINTLQPRITGKKCTGCEYCVAVCPNMAITMYRNKAIIDLSLCTGCGKCYDTCNYDAVSDIFFGELYYFGVRAFSSNNAPSQEILCTEIAYMLRYTNVEYLDSDTLMIGDIILEITPRAACGKCRFNGCFINLASNGGRGCPVGALYEDATGFIHIDQSKCIYCGYCLRQCILGLGNASIRKVVTSSEELNLLDQEINSKAKPN